MQLPAKRNDLDGKAGPSSLKLCRPCLGPDPGPGMHRRKRTQIAPGRSDDDTTDNPDVLRQPSAPRRQLPFDNPVLDLNSVVYGMCVSVLVVLLFSRLLKKYFHYFSFFFL